ncbi:hypothetical protein, partial [Mesorhizobium sp.]|uniref:hypothetical protein n=1 Tax=Mesorhizobium sp. TaxID=1871066 RepID=UPI0025F81CB5
PTFFCFLPLAAAAHEPEAVGSVRQILAEAEGPVIVYSGARKKSAETSKSIRIDVDSASALDQYFFEARKNRAFVPAFGPVWSRRIAAQGGLS